LEAPLHILVLSDRDWTHPQGGGTGTNLYGQVSRWLAWGHRVTVIACSYPGAAREERIGDLTLLRIGGRSTVFPRVIWRGLRRRLPEADVVLEVINGITFLTPLWLRTPRLALIHHVHRDHYIAEMGAPGRVAAWLLETAPLRFLYGGARFLTISNASADDIAAHGIARDQIAVGYIGVESGAFLPRPESLTPHPSLVFLGRLKRYKRIEYLLDALGEIPGGVLEIAGDGDHRPALEAAIAQRGLEKRVHMHGHVSEEKKLDLLQSAWINLTASSAEGWCLTVTEAAACATPSVAMSVGGLPESIDHGQSGLLADSPEELTEQIAGLAADRERCETLGRAARERARTFTWDRTARGTLTELCQVRDAPDQASSLRQRLFASDTGRAGGLAAALMANNFVALVFTVVFARLLGDDGYGSLGALLAAFTILVVPGSALQATVAREVSVRAAQRAEDAAAGVWRWLERLLIGTVAIAALSVLLREQISEAVGVEQAWAAAALAPSGALWLALCVQRGALQGLGRYKAVGLSIIGEASARLILGIALYSLGMGVTGAFLGTTLSIVVVSLALVPPLVGTIGPPHVRSASLRLRTLLGSAWAPVLAFSLIAALQNIDILYVKHSASDAAAGSYAAASVAAKAVIWVAIGLGLYLLPEAVRRTYAGQDARPVLWRTLALISVVAVPMVLVYAVAAEPVLRLVFGDEFTEAAGALPLLALAMSLLAAAYLGVQYLLALGRTGFVVLLAIAALAELGMLAAVGSGLVAVATVVVVLQLVLAPVLLGLSVRSAVPRSVRTRALT
jgi:glycosyltransferase involved in cell wall biosynthesis/O-antigen/teichoic acid export membrane protein